MKYCLDADPDEFDGEEEITNNASPKQRRKRSRSRSLDNDPNKRAKLGNPYEEDTSVYNDSTVKVTAKSIAHKRFTRFSVNDHLYNLSVTHLKEGNEPLVVNIANGLKTALKTVLDSLKLVYGKDLHHQVYVTIIENKILHGLNSGNYDINSPSSIIANRVLSMLYNYLKSYQTLRINPSFKIQVKVLSVPHMTHLETVGKLRNSSYQKQIYKTSRRI